MKTCRKRRYNDQYHCDHCGTEWDIDDPEPPVCRVDQAREYGNQVIKEIKESLDDD